jgi:NAD(P)-dependent dehydrogenase (short-subunit alcohol dehydrogenase family)
MERWGRVDVLVNSAGHGPRAPILEITDEQWHQGIDVYFMNVVRPTRVVTPIMVAQKGGAIINISTAWAFEPSPIVEAGQRRDNLRLKQSNSDIIVSDIRAHTGRWRGREHVGSEVAEVV